MGVIWIYTDGRNVGKSENPVKARTLRSSVFKAMKMSEPTSNLTDSLAIDPAEGISPLAREFKLEPRLLAGSAYADLHTNDVSLLIVLSQPGNWTVRGSAQALAAPDSTVSSALDRMEARGLIARQCSTSDRGVMGVEMTAEGASLAARLRNLRIEHILADRTGRVPVLTAAVAIWGVFPGLAGLSQGFWSLLAARPLVAAGEVSLVPTATNIILARTPDRFKAGAIGLFFGGIPLGVGGRFLNAGNLGPVIGWRNCFLMMAALGLACHAKSHLGDVGQFVARTATEVHGGIGVTDLLGLHYWFKRIGFNRQVLGGPTTMHGKAAPHLRWVRDAA